MSDTKFINYVEINGQDVPLDTLTAEERRRIAILLSDRFMAAAGFKRKKA